MLAECLAFLETDVAVVDESSEWWFRTSSTYAALTVSRSSPTTLRLHRSSSKGNMLKLRRVRVRGGCRNENLSSLT